MMSLARGLVVIRAFSAERPNMTVSQISQKTGIPRAAVRRCLYTLDKMGFVASVDGGAFNLRPRVLLLGHGYFASSSLSQAAGPILNRLSGPLDESSSVSVLDGDEILYIARAQTKRLMAMHLDVGSRLPAIYTSMGRVLIASLPYHEQEQYMARAKYIQYTPHSLTDATALAQELEQIRAQGFAVIDQELEAGVRSIALPIMGRDGRPMSAMSVGVHAQRMSIDDMKEKILPALQEAATELTILSKTL
ncbi:helix-turn-helix domain-containing protein [Pusillimonas harenae]|uniref:Helix-turn-helix domain-containing protein n=2 Tax=Pollutimonas harenae TaxID=657015 RepID=A0A853H3A7_9BURK|nr:IclR family transcriptional regulator C-terminal domain-containing protein [Pollutimonas harenae]NYT86732.1 helix-turn-helix domain-containing protein [Pollutimonas harenae]TEA71565.1 IclR family transcriptional regulator [Pollutimonas harenae]